MSYFNVPITKNFSASPQRTKKVHAFVFILNNILSFKDGNLTVLEFLKKCYTYGQFVS